MFLKLWLTLSILCVGCGPSARLASKAEVEQAHGIKLPDSSRNIQQLSSGALGDRGVLGVLEMNKEDIQEFLAQLQIRARSAPVSKGPADPTVNGWNVWSQTNNTFIPGDRALQKIKVTWSGPAVPAEMLSCKSTKGDWLHVELWTLPDHALIKMYTDWN